MRIRLGELRSLLREKLRSPSTQADAEDPFGKYLFAKKRKDLKGTSAAQEKDTPLEKELYHSLSQHYNNEDYTLGDIAPELISLVRQGKYEKLLSPPPGPYYRVISDVSIPTLCNILSIDKKSVVYGAPTKAKGGVMNPGGDMAGTTGIHSWSVSPDPSWLDDDIMVSDSLGQRVTSYGPSATIVLRAKKGKNFFLNPSGMSNVSGLGRFVARQGEVVSYGPVRFSASAYFAAKNEKDLQKFDLGALLSVVR